MGRPSGDNNGCNPCCCDEFTVNCLEAEHRDTVIGPAPDNCIDAREPLWQLFDGTADGEVETVAINCTIESHQVATDAIDQDGIGGSLGMGLVVNPSDPSFTALLLYWPGAESFDALSHHHHQAIGQLGLQGAVRQGPYRHDIIPPLGTVPPVDERGPWHVCGLVIRAGSNTYVSIQHGAASHGLQFGEFPRFGHCWEPLPPALSNQIGITWRKILPDGTMPALSRDELRAAGLNGSPLDQQTTYQVGLVFGITSSSSSLAPPVRTAEVLDEYDGSIRWDHVCITANFLLSCEVAFFGVPTLMASAPAHDGVSNVEPAELRGMSVELTLTAITPPDPLLNTDPLLHVYNAGYAYTGGTTFLSTGNGDTITLTIWYVPCQILVMKFEGTGTVGIGGFPPLDCPAWVHVEALNSTYTDDGVTGPPTWTGESTVLTAIDCGVTPTPNHEIRYFGVNHLSTPEQPCLGAGGATGPFSTGGYSLAPIALGMKRKLIDKAGPFPDGSCFANPCQSEIGNNDCSLSRLAMLGLGFAAHVGPIAVAGVGTIIWPCAGLIYVDISE